MSRSPFLTPRATALGALLVALLLLFAAGGVHAADPPDMEDAAGDTAAQEPAAIDPDMEAALADDEEGLLAEVQKAEAELLRKQRPYAGIYANGFMDANDIHVFHGGVFGHATVFESLKLYLQAMAGPIHQDKDGFRPETNVFHNTVEFGVEELFITPQLVVWGAALYEGFTLDEDPGPRFNQDGFLIGTREDLERGYLLGGKLGLKYIFLNESEVGLEGKRESIWKEHNTYDARLFNRVYDMSQMSADMAINKARVFSDIVTYPEHKWRTDLGIEDFEDGNTRYWGYTHYQIPVLWSRNEHWTVLRPNFYVESLREYSDAYFSPDYHITVGTMLHTIQEFEYIDLEAEVNPQLLWTKDQTQDGSTGAGIHGLANLTFKPTDGLRFGIGGFGYADTEEYWLLRGNAFVKYTF